MRAVKPHLSSGSTAMLIYRDPIHPAPCRRCRSPPDRCPRCRSGGRRRQQRRRQSPAPPAPPPGAAARRPWRWLSVAAWWAATSGRESTAPARGFRVCVSASRVHGAGCGAAIETTEVPIARSNVGCSWRRGVPLLFSEPPGALDDHAPKAQFWGLEASGSPSVCRRPTCGTWRLPPKATPPPAAAQLAPVSSRHLHQRGHHTPCHDAQHSCSPCASNSALFPAGPAAVSLPAHRRCCSPQPILSVGQGPACHCCMLTILIEHTWNALKRQHSSAGASRG